MFVVPLFSHFVFLGMLSAVFWGLHYSVAGRMGATKVSSLTLVFLPCFVSFVFQVTNRGSQIYRESWAVLAASWNADDGVAGRPASPSLMAYFALCSSYFVCNYLGMVAIRAKNATMAGLIEVSYPLWVAIISWFWFGEHNLTGSSSAGAVLIFAGVVVVMVGELSAGHDDPLEELDNDEFGDKMV